MIEAFFRLAPTSHYITRSGEFVNKEAYRQYRALVRSTRRVFVVEPLELLPGAINVHDFEAFVAFVEGYQLTVSHFTGDKSFITPHLLSDEDEVEEKVS